MGILDVNRLSCTYHGFMFSTCFGVGICLSQALELSGSHEWFWLCVQTFAGASSINRTGVVHSQVVNYCSWDTYHDSRLHQGSWSVNTVLGIMYSDCKYLRNSLIEGAPTKLTLQCKCTACTIEFRGCEQTHLITCINNHPRFSERFSWRRTRECEQTHLNTW